MIVEHPFGTIKRGWGVYFFLTKRKVSVSTEISLSFLAYNLKRVINILGTEVISSRLRQRRKGTVDYINIEHDYYEIWKRILKKLGREFECDREPSPVTL